MSPILYKFGNTNYDLPFGDGVLSDNIKAEITEEANGVYTMTMVYPINGMFYKELVNGAVIKANNGVQALGQNQRFEIVSVTKPLNGQVTVFAEHSSYKTADAQIKPGGFTVSGVSAKDALTAWKNAIIGGYSGNVDSDITTPNGTIIAPPDFENARMALGGHTGSILDVWGGQYGFDNEDIHLYKQRGQVANAQIRYGKNLKNFSLENSIEDTYTSIMPFAKVQVDGTDGATATEETKFLSAPYYVDSAYVGAYSRRKIKQLDFSTYFDEDNPYTEAKLLSLATQYITDNNVGVPDVSITLEPVDLAKIADSTGHENIQEVMGLWDTVPVIVDILDIMTTAQITQTVWDVNNESYVSMQLGARATT